MQVSLACKITQFSPHSNHLKNYIYFFQKINVFFWYIQRKSSKNNGEGEANDMISGIVDSDIFRHILISSSF